MNKRDVFLPSISTLTILGMMVFYSCAHQNRVQDELDASTDEESVSGKAETEVAEAAKDTTETVSNDLDMTKLGDETKTENKVEEVKTEAEQSLTTAATESSEKIDNTDLATLGVESDPTSTEKVDSKTEIPASDPLAEFAENKQVETKLEETKLEKSKPVIDEPVFSKPARTRKSFAGGYLRVPKIPAKPIVKNGTSLNRFYFVRKGDTPQSVSEMIYGSTGHVADLRKWNAASQWSPGHIIFYSSPVNPKDNQIGSFYRENGVEAEEYTVGKGDWISKIAFKKLGSPESWKEVAVINGMSRPDKIEVGQRIAIYPRDLSKFIGNESVASSKPAPPVPSVPQLAQVPPQQPAYQPPVQVPPPQIPNEVQNAVPEPPPQQAEAPKPIPKPPKSQAFDTSKLVEQNLPAAVILAGVLILSAAYLAVRRRKIAKQQSDEFDEMPSNRSNRK